MKRIKVTSAEFALSNGVHIVWHKEASGWNVTKYRHGERSMNIHTLKKPSIEEANYFNRTLL